MTSRKNIKNSYFFDYTDLDFILNKKKILLSSTFPTRTKCKKCLKLPSLYYCVRNPSMSLDPRTQLNNALKSKKKLRRVIYSFFMMEDPSNFVRISSYGHKPFYKGANIRMHKNVGIINNKNYTEYATCECGATSWAYSQKPASSRPEISNRKSRKVYPIKIDY